MSDDTPVKAQVVLVPVNEEDRIVLDPAGDPIGDSLSARMKANDIDEWSMMTSEEDNLVSVKFVAESKAQSQEMADKLCSRGEVALLFYEGDDTVTREDGSVAPLGVLLLDSASLMTLFISTVFLGNTPPV